MLAKAKMTEFYNKNAKECTLKTGNIMVLVRKPELHTKLECAWAGSFMISEKVSPVNFHCQVITGSLLKTMPNIAFSSQNY